MNVLLIMGGCDHICHNRNGNFSCDCQGGFLLNSDKFSCDGVYHIFNSALLSYNFGPS